MLDGHKNQWELWSLLGNSCEDLRPGSSEC